MAITEIINLDGEKSYDVYVNIRSKCLPHIRKQKRVVGLGSRAEAIRKEKKLIKEISLKVAREEGYGLTWRMVIYKWESYAKESLFLDKKYDEATIRDYVSMMFNWTNSWLDRPASTITRGDGRDVLFSTVDKGRSRAFQKRLKNTINMIFNWAIEEKIIRDIVKSPVYGLKLNIKEEKFPEILTLSEIQKFLYNAKTQNHKWFPIWATALFTGMRNGELFALRWEDIDLGNRLIRVKASYNKRTKEFKTTKAGYWRNVPISNDLYSVLAELKKDSSTKNDDFVLPRIKEWVRGEQSKVLRGFLSSIGIPSVKFHTLRACFATQMLSQGVDLSKVMKIGGWRDIKTAQIYLRLAGVDERGATDNLSFLVS